MSITADPMVIPGLTGRACVVTGAASGIGDAVVRTLLASGARVTSVDLHEPTAAVDDHIRCDLSDPGSISQAVDKISTVDGLYNVAGVPGTRPAELVLKVNFLGPRMLTEALIPRIAPGGTVVNVASTAGTRWQERLAQLIDLVSTHDFEAGASWYAAHPLDTDAAPEIGPYEISKEAMTVYTMWAASRSLDRGVRVNAVSPGPVTTPILGDFEDSMGKSVLDFCRDTVGRHATPDDIAPIVAFLSSPASRWVNGFNIVADGGILAAMTTGSVTMPIL